MNHYISIYSKLNFRLLVQIANLPFTQRRWVWVYYIWANMFNISLTKLNNTSTIELMQLSWNLSHLILQFFMFTINTHKKKIKKRKKKNKRDAGRIVFAMIDRKWIWDIDNLLYCLHGVFVFFSPSCRTIGSIRKRCFKITESLWANHEIIKEKLQRAAFLFLWSKTRGRPGQGIKVDRSIWMIAMSPGTYYSILIIYAISPYDWWLYLCLFSFLSFSLRYVVSRV